ncbi:MAG: hypothetical protein OEX02_01125 [Cyclobacteriaceae bacterium]|nr:hypothetical protein [Cyclobacteriaceae bacterium]
MLSIDKILDMFDPVWSNMPGNIDNKRLLPIINNIPEMPGQMFYIHDYHINKFVIAKGFKLNLGVDNPLVVHDLYGLIHPEDLYVTLKLVKSLLSYCLKVDIGKPFDLVFSNDYRLRAANGEYKRFVRNSYAIGFTGKIFNMTLNILTDITHIKKEGEVSWHLHGPRSGIFKREFEKELKSLDNKPREIKDSEAILLRMIAKGWPSERIAEAKGAKVDEIEQQKLSLLRKFEATSITDMLFKAIKSDML